MSNIDKALLQAYSDGAFGLTTAEENKNFEPTAGAPWAEVFIVSNPSTPHTYGDGGQDLYDGFMQINLNYPLNTYAGAAKTKAAAIVAYFKNGTRFTYSGQEVFITSSGRNGSGREVDGWYRTDITIYWEARVTR